MVNQGSYDLRHDVDRLQNKVSYFENTFANNYFIECSAPAIFYKDTVFSPTSLTFYGYKDSMGKITTYKGVLKVYSSVDGITYNLVKTSTDANTTITISDTSIKFYKGELYSTDNELYDVQTVPVLRDGKDGINGKDGANGKTPILHVRYAKTTDPTSLSELKTYPTTEYRYQGVCWNYSDTAPTSVDDYKPFVLFNAKDGIPGADGENSYVHIAYANSEDGFLDFTNEIPDYDPIYMGILINDVKEDSDNYKDYKWSLIQGEDGICVFLGNESQLIPCTSDGKVQEELSFTIPFYCYKGTSMYACNYVLGSTNYWTQQGFTYTLNKQCSATDNGLITITAPKDATLRGLKHSILTLTFNVDGEIISKEFNWAKVIKGADGTDGVDGDDGKNLVMYVRYSQVEKPTSLKNTLPYEQTGYKYQGIAWAYEGVTPTISDYYPFTNYNPKDGIAGVDGWVHIAYSLTSNGRDASGKVDKSFTPNTPRYTPLYMGTYTDDIEDDSTNPDDYTWTLIKGTDGITPSTEKIQEIVAKTDVNATTLNGNTEDNFLSAEIPTTTIYRNDRNTTKNYVKLYRLGDIVICQVFNFNDDNTNYGQDPDNTSYFLLMPSTKVIPDGWRPQTPLYMNDLNKADGTSNGRIRISTAGKVTKLGTAGTSYNNTYATFIYPILPKQDTTVSPVATKLSTYGDYVEVEVISGSSKVTGIPVLFTFSKPNTAGDEITLVSKTDSNGFAQVNALIEPGTAYTCAIQCVGNSSYKKSNVYSLSVKVGKTTVKLTASYSNKVISGTVKNKSNIPLPNTLVLLNDVYNTTTDSNGNYSFTVSSNSVYTVSVPANDYGTNKGISARVSKTVSVTGL